MAAQGGGLRPQEAVMLLDWAIEAEDPKRKADLLDLFAQAGGMRLLREAVLGDEPGEKSDDD